MKINLGIKLLMEGFENCKAVLKTDKELNDVFLKAEYEHISISAVTEKNYFSQTIEGNITEEGSMVFNIENINLFKKLKNDLELGFKDNSIFFTDGKKSMELPQTKTEIPRVFSLDIERFNFDYNFSVPEKELLKLIAVQYASSDPIRPTYNSVVISGNDFVACDANRVAYKKASFTAEFNENFIIPIETIGILKGLLNAKGDTDVNVSVLTEEKDKYVRFGTSNMELICKCVPGNFIDYKKVLESKVTDGYYLDRKELLEEIDYVKGFKDSNPFIRLTFKDEKLGLKTLSEKSFKYSSNVDARVFAGGAFEITVDNNFIYDSLKNRDSLLVYIEFTGEKSPIFIRNEDGSHVDMILPIVKTSNL